MNKSQKIALVVIAIVGVSFGGWFIYDRISAAFGVGTTPFIDSKGRWVYVPHHPNRIVSVAPSITEILFAIKADDRLVGITDYCNYPAATKNKTSIGGFTTPNLEVLTNLNPDLIIVADDNPDNLQVLENTGIPVVVILAHTIGDVIQNIGKIGNLVDSQAAAAILADNMTARLNAVLAKTQSISSELRLKSYFEVWETPTVAGARSFINDLITIAGGTNIFGDVNDEWPTVTNEMVISKNPDVIFVTAMGRAFYSTDISNRTGYNTINAVKNNRIYTCDDDIFTRPGPRIIDAAETMAKYLHPSLFL